MRRFHALERLAVGFAQFLHGLFHVGLRFALTERVDVLVRRQRGVIGVVLAVVVEHAVLGQQREAAEELGIVGLPDGGEHDRVDRREDGLAEVLVLNGRSEFGVLGLEVEGIPVRRNGLLGQVYVLVPFGAAHAGDLFGGQGRGCDITSLEHLEARNAIGDVLPAEPVEGQVAGVPVILVLCQDDLFVEIPVGDVIAAAVKHLILAETVIFADLVQECLLYGQQQIELRIGQEVRIGTVQRVFHSEFVKRLDADRLVELRFGFFAGKPDVFAVVDIHEIIVVVVQAVDDSADGAETACGVVGLGYVAHACDEVVCGDLVVGLRAGAVDPVDAVPEMERPDAVVIVVLPALGEARHGASVFVGLHEAVDEIRDEHVVRGAGGGVLVHRRDRRRERGFVFFEVIGICGLSAGRRSARAARQQAGEQACRQQECE